MKYPIKKHTFKILISFPSSICDFDRFFLLILLIATSQSVFWKGKTITPENYSTETTEEKQTKKRIYKHKDVFSKFM